VGLFLVLSGFSIHYRMSEHGEPERFRAGRFWRRRFWRLYPTYIAAVLFAIGVLWIVNGDVSVHGDWKTGGGAEPVVILIIGQVSLIAANLITVPFIGPTWSLALEVQLYAAYSLFVRHLRRIGVVRITLWSLALAVAWNLAAELVTTSVPVGQFKPGGESSDLSRVFYAQLPARWFEWMIGLLVAEAYFGRVRLWAPLRRVEVVVPALIIFGALFREQIERTSLNGHPFFASDVFLNPLAGVAFAGVLIWAIGLSNHKPGPVSYKVFAPLAFVGLFSYSLYLTHGSFITAGEAILPDSTPSTVSEIFLFALSIVGAWVFFLVVERRYLRPGPERAATPSDQTDDPSSSSPAPARAGG
jgi:mycarose O-acyltransferase